MIVAVVAIGVVVVTLVSRSRRPAAVSGGGPGPAELSPAAEQSALGGDVRNLRPGDVVNHDGNDYLVERTMVFDEDGFTWSEHLLDDPVGGRAMWLSVEDDDGLELVLYERLRGAALEPGPDAIAHEGTDYRLDERGRARFTTQTREGAGESGDMEYADYVRGDRVLAFERYGTGGWETSLGVVVEEHSLDVYRR